MLLQISVFQEGKKRIGEAGKKSSKAVAYYKDDIIINNIEYNLPNRNSRGKIELRDLIYVNFTMNKI